jgi:alpha-tubulin suppressor-like RCC1 family protein
VVPPIDSPVPLGLQVDATSVSSGIRHSIARTSDGRVWVWGLAPDGVTTVAAPTVLVGFTLN